jgi:hypothetical protein
MTNNNSTDWENGELQTRWSNSTLDLRWTMGYSQVTISHLSTEYVIVPISANKEGISYNPTGDEVFMAFMPNAIQQPGNTDWMTSSWDTDTTNIIYPYAVKCLVGPSGVITLNPGTYVLFVKIEDNPETPVLTVGQLIVS